MITYGELFAGIGGFGLGFTRAGMVGRWYVERDPAARQVLARHWPDATAYEDVTHEADDATREPVDLISGGFPCQDLSVAGRRAGLAGERSGLWFAFHRILERARPRWTVIENVPGLLSSNGGRDFAVVLRGLVELGYGVAWRVFDSQHFGLAQRRQRLFIVGHLGTGRAAEVLFEPTGRRGHSAAQRTPGADIAGTLDTSAGRARGAGINPGSLIPFDTTQITSAANRSAPKPGDPCHPLAAGAHPPAIALSNRGRVTGNVTETLRAASHGALPMIAHALTTPSGQRMEASDTYPLIASGARRLMPIECERLQGFEDNWTAGHSDSARYRMLGNAVSAPVAEWIGRRIVALEFTESPLIGSEGRYGHAYRQKDGLSPSG